MRSRLRTSIEGSRVPPLSFLSPIFGDLRFWVDANPSYMQLDSSRIEQITDRGTLGLSWAGNPVGDEFTSTTTDGIPTITGVKTVAQYGLASGASSLLGFLHLSQGVNLYIFSKFTAPTGDDDTYIATRNSTDRGVSLFYRKNTPGRILYTVVGDTEVVFSASGDGFTPDEHQVAGIHYDLTGLQFSRNGLYIGSNIPLSNPYSTNPIPDIQGRIMNWGNPASGLTAQGPMRTFLGYAAQKHSASKVAQIYNLFKQQDPGILP